MRRFFRREDGATSIEYALIASLIAMVIIVGVRSIGTNLRSTYTSVGSAFTTSR